MNPTQRATSTYPGYPVPQRRTNMAQLCDKDKSAGIHHYIPDTPYLPSVLQEKKAGTTLLTAKGKGSIKPVSLQERFFTMLCNRCLPVDEAEQDARQRQKAVKLTREAVNKFFKTFKKTESKSTDFGVVNLTDDLLNLFAQSPFGERLFRKSAAENLVGIESLLRSAGVNIDHQSKKSGNSPLIAAALGCHWNMVSTLIDAGARANLLNKRYQHVLQLIFQAMSDKTIDKNQHDQLIMKILQQQGDSKITVWPNRTISLSIFAVREAALRANILMLDRLLREIPLLIDALKQNMEAKEVLRLLVTSSDNLSPVIRHLLKVKDRYGKQVFNLAFTSMGDTPLMLAAGCRKYYTMKLLLDYPEVVRRINHYKIHRGIRWSAFTYLHQQNNFEMMGLLLSKGAKRYNAPPPDPIETSGSYSSSGIVYGGSGGADCC